MKSSVMRWSSVSLRMAVVSNSFGRFINLVDCTACFRFSTFALRSSCALINNLAARRLVLALCEMWVLMALRVSTDSPLGGPWL